MFTCRSHGCGSGAGSLGRPSTPKYCSTVVSVRGAPGGDGAARGSGASCGDARRGGRRLRGYPRLGAAVGGCGRDAASPPPHHTTSSAHPSARHRSARAICKSAPAGAPPLAAARRFKAGSARAVWLRRRSPARPAAPPPVPAPSRPLPGPSRPGRGRETTASKLLCRRAPAAGLGACFGWAPSPTPSLPRSSSCIFFFFS